MIVQPKIMGHLRRASKNERKRSKQTQKRNPEEPANIGKERKIKMKLIIEFFLETTP